MEEKDLPYDINDVLKYVSLLRLYHKERVFVVMLDNYKVINCYDITTVSRVSSASSDIVAGLKMANKLNCNQIIVCHNHPNQLIIPSNIDIIDSKDNIRIAKEYNISVIDELIITYNSYSSRVLNNWFDMNIKYWNKYIVLENEQREKHEKDLEEFNKLFS